MKTVFITGTSRGIGKATAARFLDNGYIVIGTSTSGNSDLTHSNFTCLQLDLANPSNIQAFLANHKPNTLDILINNAGILLESWSDPTPKLDAIKATFQVNLFGLIELTEGLIPAMTDNGHIVNISSGWGAFNIEPFTDIVPGYKMTKSALNQYTLLLAKRFEGRIKASSIHPGWVQTDMGTQNAPTSPDSAADDIYYVATTEGLATGGFWHNKVLRDW